MVKIPNRLEDLYPATAIEKILDVLQQPDLTDRVRETLDRVGIRGNNPLDQVQHAWQQARSWIESLASGASGEPYIINATGQLFHSDFANLPVSSTVAQVYAGSATKFQHAERLLERSRRAADQTAFPGKQVAWLTSVYVALQQLLKGKQVMIPRSDLVRIQGVGDVAALLSGIDVTEVGPVNGCSEDDWGNACADPRPESQVILLVSPNGRSAESAQEQRKLALRMAKKFHIPVLALQADTACSDRLQAKLGCPTVPASLDSGIDCVVAPLDLLLGGPQGAVAIGSEAWIEPLRHSAASNGTLLNGAGLAAANVAIQLSHLENPPESGIERCLLGNPQNLEERARRVAIQLAGNGIVQTAAHLPRSVPLGPAPWDCYALENWCVELTSEFPVQRLRSRLLSGLCEGGEPMLRPIAGICQDDRLILDLRFVDPEDDHLLVAAMSRDEQE